jgi:hypothetical protein
MSSTDLVTPADPASIEQRRRAIIERYGEWTDHNIHLGGNLYTVGPDKVPEKVRRTVQVVADLVGKPLDQIRVLDLACLEGLYATEFARHGAQAVGIEGREANIAKARFTKEALGLENLTFFQDDIRNLNPEKYGYFDVVLCLGVFYHLDAPAIFRLAEQMAAVCRRLLYMDTYIGVYDRNRYDDRGHTYWGISVGEHVPGRSTDQKLADLWASLDNERSVWLTRPSLLNLLAHAGFTSVYECHNPSELEKSSDRISLAAIKGEHHRVLSVPRANEAPIHDWPEHLPPNINPSQKRFYELSKRVHIIPHPLRKWVKKTLRKIGILKETDAPWEWDEPFKSRDHKSS